MQSFLTANSSVICATRMYRNLYDYHRKLFAYVIIACRLRPHALTGVHSSLSDDPFSRRHNFRLSQQETQFQANYPVDGRTITSERLDWLVIETISPQPRLDGIQSRVPAPRPEEDLYLDGKMSDPKLSGQDFEADNTSHYPPSEIS